MNATTIDQACDPSNWRWKRWDVRADGKVFWRYQKNCLNGEFWITWKSALKCKNDQKLQEALYCQTQKSKDYKKTYQKTYRKTQKRRNYINLYFKSRRLSDPIFDMSLRIRKRIQKAIRAKGYSKQSKTQNILGCDWNYLKAHLESQFVDGMSWDNRNLWHVDHIIPLASATSETDIIKLNHYTNLQPLWAADNLSKGAKIIS